LPGRRPGLRASILPELTLVPSSLHPPRSHQRGNPFRTEPIWRQRPATPPTPRLPPWTERRGVMRPGQHLVVECLRVCPRPHPCAKPSLPHISPTHTVTVSADQVMASLQPQDRRSGDHRSDSWSLAQRTDCPDGGCRHTRPTSEVFDRSVLDRPTARNCTTLDRGPGRALWAGGERSAPRPRGRSHTHRFSARCSPTPPGSGHTPRRHARRLQYNPATPGRRSAQTAAPPSPSPGGSPNSPPWSWPRCAGRPAR
jgi:hypothetical protein